MTLSVAVRGFYRAVGAANPELAGSMVREVSFSKSSRLALLPAAQVALEVDEMMGERLMRHLLCREPSRNAFADEVSRAEPDTMSEMADCILAAPFKRFFCSMDQFREICDSLRAGKRSVPPPLCEEPEGLTTEDRKFMSALGLEGDFSREQLFHLTYHLLERHWGGLPGNLSLHFSYVAQLCSESDLKLMGMRIGVGPATIVQIRAYLQELGLSLGMPIKRVDPIAIGGYALYRAGLQPGSEKLKQMSLSDLPEGLPLTRFGRGMLRGGLKKKSQKPICTVGDLVTISAAKWAKLAAYGFGLLPKAWLQIKILGFEDQATAPQDKHWKRFLADGTRLCDRIILDALSEISA
jgi:hypothetical protein